MCKQNLTKTQTRVDGFFHHLPFQAKIKTFFFQNGSQFVLVYAHLKTRSLPVKIKLSLKFISKCFVPKVHYRSGTPALRKVASDTCLDNGCNLSGRKSPLGSEWLSRSHVGKIVWLLAITLCYYNP